MVHYYAPRLQNWGSGQVPLLSRRRAGFVLQVEARFGRPPKLAGKKSPEGATETLLNSNVQVVSNGHRPTVTDLVSNDPDRPGFDLGESTATRGLSEKKRRARAATPDGQMTVLASGGSVVVLVVPTDYIYLTYS